MNAIRNLFLITSITLGGIAACNYTVGECYYRGEGGGSGSEAVAAGGGVILPTGPTGGGGYGDEPPEQPQDALDPKPKCNSDEEEPEFGKPADQYIDCRKRGLSADACSKVCIEAGAGCGPIVGHPKKSGQPLGQLIWCKNGSPTYVCDYAFPNGDSCAGTFTPLGAYWLCAYPGGK